MKRLLWIGFILTFLGLVGSVCSGQFGLLPPKSFEFSHFLSVDGVTPGGAFQVALVWKIPERFYLYRDTISVKPVHPDAFASFDVSVPEGVDHVDEVTPQPRRVFFNELRVVVTCRVRPDVAPGAFRSAIQVGWQGCGDRTCFRPDSATVPIDLPVVAGPAGIKQLNPELFVSSVKMSKLHPEPSQRFGIVLSALIALLGGIWASLTPCVFPLIPVIIGVVGIEAGRTSRLRGLWLSAAYVAGLVLVYSLLGGFAGLLGKIVFIDPRDLWVRVVGALILVALAAAMFGWYNIALPGWLTSRLSRRWSGGAVGAMLAGVASALLATTCVAVPLLTALGYAARAQSVPTGMLLGGSFALGMGLLLIAVGTFAGLVERLASGEWMVWVKHAMGMMLVGMALYFLQPVLPDVVWKFAIAGFLLVAGILALVLGRASWVPRLLSVLLLVAAGGVLTVTALGLSGYGAGARAQSDSIAWVTDVDEGLAQAAKEGKPAVIDFWATWCEECRVMDLLVLSDPVVVAESKRFVMIRANITNAGPKSDTLQKRFGVYLPPTVVFVSSDGSFRTVPGRPDLADFLAQLRRLK